MDKKQTSDLHRTQGGSRGFNLQLKSVTQFARQEIAELVGCRKRDMAASGAIHALALLIAETSGPSLWVTQQEVDSWRETFFTWFNAVKRYFTGKLGQEFREKAEADFALIREKAGTYSSSPWQQVRDIYQRPVVYLNRETFDRAAEAAKKKYPVNSGFAIDRYLQACVQRLLKEEDVDAPLVVSVPAKPKPDAPGTVALRLVGFEDGVHSLIVTSFDGLQKPARSGRGLQNAVRKFISKRDKQVLAELEFDSESSMFCVRSKSLAALGLVSEAIYTIAENAIVGEASST